MGRSAARCNGAGSAPVERDGVDPGARGAAAIDCSRSFNTVDLAEHSRGRTAEAEGRSMRYLTIAVALAAVPASAQAQPATSWQYYEPEGGTMQAGVVNPQGAQLIIKCDKPGKGQVYAVVVTPEKLVPPSDQPFVTRALEMRFDAGATIDDRWRYYEQSVVAIDQKPTIALTRVLNGLADASKFHIRMNPERARYVEAEFDVTGARDAIGRVYSSCQDESPVSPPA
jgi:hypothetical protein